MCHDATCDSTQTVDIGDSVGIPVASSMSKTLVSPVLRNNIDVTIDFVDLAAELADPGNALNWIIYY